MPKYNSRKYNKPQPMHTGSSPKHYPPIGSQYARDVVSDATDDIEYPHRRIDDHHGADGIGWNLE